MDQQASVFDAQGVIDVQHCDGCSPDRRLADESGPAPFKVFGPVVGAGIELSNQCVGKRVISRCERSLGRIARRAGETKIVQRSRAAEFLGPDVIEFVWQRRKLLRQLTILTAIAGSLHHPRAARLGHRSIRCAGLIKRQPRFGLHQVEKLAHPHVLVQHGTVGFVDGAFVILVE